MGLVMALTLAACVSPATPEQIQKGRTRPVGLTDWGGDLFSRARGGVDRKTTGSVSTEERDMLLETGLHLDAEGFIYHPNLLEWTVSGRFGLTQEQTTTSDGDFGTRGLLTGFDLSALAFKEKPVFFRAFAKRVEDLRERDFAPNTTVTETRFGGEVFWRSRLPMSLLAEYVQIDEQDILREMDETTARYRFTVRDQRHPDWLTELVYKIERTERTSTTGANTAAPIVQDLPETLDELTMSNLWRFGSGPLKHELSGQGRWMRRGWFFPNTVVTLNQRLDLHHSETFSTFYSVALDSDEVEDELDRTLTGEAGLTKRFYKSLDVTARLLGWRRTLNDGQEDHFGAFVEADYRKETRIGLYTSSLTLGWETERESFEGGVEVIRDEPVKLTGLGFAELSQPSVVDGSIRVTDQTRTIEYSPTTDYEIRTTGQRTDIARRGGSTIASGETVLVTYTVVKPRDATFHVNQMAWRSRLVLKRLPLTVYARWRKHDEILDSGEDPGNLDQTSNVLGGLELNYKGLRIAAEHEVQDQSLSAPWTSDRVELDYRRRLSRRVEMSAGANAEYLRYRQAEKFGLGGSASSLTTLSARAALTARLGRNLLLRFSGDVIRTRGREERTEFTGRASLQWQYGHLDLVLDVYYDAYTQRAGSSGADSTGHSATVKVSIRRKF